MRPASEEEKEDLRQRIVKQKEEIAEYEQRLEGYNIPNLEIGP